MSKIHQFDLNPYPRKLWIAIGKDPHRDIFGDDIPEMDETVDAMACNAYDGEKGGLFLRFENIEAMTTSNIAHESVYIAMEVVDYIGATIDLNNQEYFSYLVGYIAQHCEDVKLIESNVNG